MVRRALLSGRDSGRLGGQAASVSYPRPSTLLSHVEGQTAAERTPRNIDHLFLRLSCAILVEWHPAGGRAQGTWHVYAPTPPAFSNQFVDDGSTSDALTGFRRSNSPSSLPSPSDPSDRGADHRRALDLESASGSSHRHYHHSHRRSKHFVPNYRDFPPDQSPFSPRIFSSELPGNSPTDSDVSAGALFTPGPREDPMMYIPDVASRSAGQGPSAEIDPRHPPALTEAAAEAFADRTSSTMLVPGVDNPAAGTSLPDSPVATHTDAPSNFSQSGIVHLAPVDNQDVSRSSSEILSCRQTSLVASTSGNGSSVSSGHPVLSRCSGSGSRGQSTHLSHSHSDPSSSYVTSGSASVVSGSSGSSGPHMTLRYQHVEDENGHHLIVGREGKLTKCEDEPIRTPGAVQGFGILIAVEEDLDTGNLIVRQVSENSTELLGLSPSYLFGLECFSQTFPEPQADMLFGNIQYLSDTALTVEEQAENLHVFMVSGWGEPGTALPEEPPGDEQSRRLWTCWCAAHRPQMSAPANLAGSDPGLDNAYQNIIILEFELERDSFNPLYPPPPVSEEDSVRSGVSSPSNVSVSASTSSGRTLVSTSEESVAPTTPEEPLDSPPVLSDNPSTSSLAASSLSVATPDSASLMAAYTLPGQEDWTPSPEDILESTTSRSKPLLALERLRRTKQPSEEASFADSANAPRSRANQRRRKGAGAVGMMDVFAVMAQINEQLGAAPDLDTFLKVTAGVVKDLTQFHRVLVYQFDEAWNGQVVSELVDWSQTHDLYRGLHFPASDIPAQVRLMFVDKVRLLYDRGQPTARLVVRSKADLEKPLDMTHCYLRAMSPIHLKYLENMGVRASMSVSIIAFGTLWGLVACHSYGPHGMRVSFPVRQMLRLLSQSISRNIERLSYAQRLHTRKLINTMPTDQHPRGYIVSNADDLLSLFDADYGVLVIGEGAKILGPNEHGQEILIVAEYLRLKQFTTLQVSQAVTVDFPDLHLTTGLEVIAGLLYVPLSTGGRDFIAFLRKGQPREVNWAGRPTKTDGRNVLEPRRSFKTWSEMVAGRCRAWSDEHLETAGVLALVYGKFIEVWRQKENALQTTKLTNILLSNASHEVRTPLNHIINYLELAMNGPLDTETRENLSHSHAASKSLLFTINDLLDLTRLESGNETSFNEPFDLPQAIDDATQLYRNEARRRGLEFILSLQGCPKQVVGDSRKIRTVVANLTANALKYTTRGSISVLCRAFEEPTGLRDSGDLAVEIVVADTGCGIPSDKLEGIFREFEQVETTPRTHSPGLGLGLAVVARIVEQLGGQLRVDSSLGKGSRFSFLLPLTTDIPGKSLPWSSNSSRSSLVVTHDAGSRTSEIQDLVDALSASHMDNSVAVAGPPQDNVSSRESPSRATSGGHVESSGSGTPLRPVDEFDLDHPLPVSERSYRIRHSPSARSHSETSLPNLRILVVEDNDINRMILAKRLSLDGHTVVNTSNGQEGIEVVQSDRNFDCVLMDIQMPLLNGYEATERIRVMEKEVDLLDRASHQLNGRIPIFAVSASLFEHQRDELYRLGMDGWILKPIDFKRLRAILRGVVDPAQREKDIYRPGISWEFGGWFSRPKDKTA
ncbi:hypothetical protein C8Q77DRAFT_1065052 [Trametes polyzona]|nr:hypothetical protein C8Q77DRAFT_1065052 [Trametes polyzona]